MLAHATPPGRLMTLAVLLGMAALGLREAMRARRERHRAQLEELRPARWRQRPKR